jgi:protein-S-isoprenylcysteine O-methyltransferase Ste14
MYHKSSSFFESQRKRISRFFAGLLLVFSVIMVPVDASASLYEFMELLGFILLIVAALGRVWCSIYISGRKNQELCTAGPYSLCRNPLYLFSFVGVIGFFVALQSLLLCAVAMGLFLLYYRGVILSEEQRLAHLFGDSFEQYVQTTPRFFPAFSSFTTLEELKIAPRIIERGLREVVWFLLAIACIELIEMLHEQGHLIYFRLPF